MSNPVFLVPSVPDPGEFVLGGDEGRHAATVRRIRPGEHLVLCDGDGTWAPASVTGIRGRAVVLEVAGRVTEPEPAPSITVIQALPKGDHADRSVDLATQAGADAIVPWQAARCVSRWDSSPEKAGRGRAKWTRIAREATKQARRRRVPYVARLATHDDVLTIVRSADCALALHEEESAALAAIDLPRAGTIVVLIGPEGGLSPSEVDDLTAAGAHPARLGPEVLRSSSAAAVALGALGVLTGRWT